jgi:hypothetical protein
LAIAAESVGCSTEVPFLGECDEILQLPKQHRDLLGHHVDRACAGGNQAEIAR